MKQSLFYGFRVVLASKSPRRKQLLAGMDIPFSLMQKETDESFPNTLAVNEVAGFLSEKKANAFRMEELPENFLLITADTVVIVENQILNKPIDRTEAIAMLTLLSGREHTVVTGVSLRTRKQMVTFSESSDVRFVHLSDDEIAYYVDHYHPYDKAGSYGIQEWIGYVAIESVKGSFFNVMGLPTHKLYREMEKLMGISLKISEKQTKNSHGY